MMRSKWRHIGCERMSATRVGRNGDGGITAWRKRSMPLFNWKVQKVMAEQNTTGFDALTAAVVALTRHGIRPEIQELLIYGDPLSGVRPGALAAALSAGEGSEARRHVEGSMSQTQTTRGLPSGDDFLPKGRAEIDRIIADVKADTERRKTTDPLADLDIHYHAAMPNWCKLVGLEIRAIHASEGGGFMVRRDQAERIMELLGKHEVQEL